MTRVIAIDWSGDKKHAAEKIWAAVVEDGCLVDLFNGRNREEIRDYLIEAAASDPNLIVGLDFAFSMPQSFVGMLRHPPIVDATELWKGIQDSWGEEWLGGTHPRFWGRVPRDSASSRDQDLRLTESALRDRRGKPLIPKSVFQTGGVGAVGTGSIRGMPILFDLHAAGFCIWPFTGPRAARPVAVEIYPRLFIGNVRKSDPKQRREHVEQLLADYDRTMLNLASCSEDSFDAACSAMAMWEAVGDLETLPDVGNGILRMEGIIWNPWWRDLHPNWSSIS